MHIEYDWMTSTYKPRFGDTFIDIDGQRSFDSLDDVKAALSRRGLRLGRKTDTRTWAIELAETVER